MDDQAILRNAIYSANTNIAMLSAFVVAGVEYNGDMPHKLLHFVVDEHFQATGVVFASPYVAEEITKRITEDRKQEVRLLISATEGV